MSWHYSQELGEGFSVGAYLVGLRWRPVRSIPTVGASCSSDKETERLTPSRSGMTCRPSTASRGAGVLTSLPQAGPAKGSAQQARAEGSTMSDPAYGLRWPALSMRFDRALYSWKTARALFPLEGLPDASPTLPRSGMMRRGILSERDTLAHRTGAIDAGSLPRMATPTATANQLSPSMMKHPGCRAWLPAPSATNYGSNGDPKAWKEGRPHKRRPSLQTMARHNTWPTPCATEVRQGYQDGNRGKRGSQKSLTTEVIDRAGGPAVVGGKLSPAWVEWLMGWPIGFSALEPLEMDRFHRWPRSPFKPCVPDSTAGGEE